MKTVTAGQGEVVARSAEPAPAFRWALASLSLSMLLSSLGISIANVALPTLARAFSASFQQVQWIVLAYLLAITTLIVSVGRLGDLVGRRSLLLAGILLFTVASLLCGAAPTLQLLIAARAAQGLGAAIMLALTMAFVGETVPKARTGSAMGLLGTMSAVGTALGPSLGGLLIAGFGWPAIFFVNVPLGIVALLLAHRFLPLDRPRTKTDRTRFDHPGTLLLALTLAAYALAMTTGRGSVGPRNVALLFTALVGVALFALAEARAASPLIPLTMFRNPILSAGFATSTLVTTVVMATLVVGPFYLSGALGLDAARVGLVMSTGPIVAALTGVPAGRTVDRFGAYRMSIVGLIGMVAGSSILPMLPTRFGVPGYIAPLVVITAGYALFQAANNTAVMTNIRPDQRGVTSGMLNLSRNLGLITGASVMGTVFALGAATANIVTARPEAVAAGMRLTFVVAAMLVVVAIAIASFGQARARRGTPLVAAALLAAWLSAATPAPLVAQAGGLRDDLPDSVLVRTRYVKHEHRIAMRDGARLFTVVYVPKDASAQRRYPIVLLRTPFSVAPYGPDAYAPTLGPDRFMLRDEYIFVSQDVRGRYMSEGTFENVRPLLPDSVKARDPRAVDEATDTYDTIEWLLRNVPGNNGRVGQWGISYAGFHATAGLLSRHPALVASSPQAPVADVFFEDFHHNGALTQGYFYSYPVFGIPRPELTTRHWWLPEFLKISAHGMADDYFYQLSIGPLRNTTARFYPDNTFWRQIVTHPNYDAFWQARALPPRLRGVRHAVLLVGGWFDAENLYGPLAVYRALRERSPEAEVTLVMGPFGHRGWAARDVGRTVHGDFFFGDSLAMRFQRDVEAPFFRAHLKEETAVAPRGALVFDTGRRTWVPFDRWPAPASVPRAWFLHADGSLRASAPSAPRAFLEYPSDPRKPVPSRCKGPTIEDGTLFHYMSDDQRCFASRPDVLVFQTDTLRQEVTLAGELTATLFVSTTGTDADFVVKVIDVYPPDEPGDSLRADTTAHLGGYQQLVRGEIMRARFRRSFAEPVPFRPNEVAEVAFRLQDVFHTFRKGHRIMVQVQSSWFPAFDRNPQTFVPNIYEAEERDFIEATHRVWMSRTAASRIEGRVLP